MHAFSNPWFLSEFFESAMQHLAAGHDQQENSSSGPDRNNNKQKQHTHTRLSRKAEKVKGTYSYS
jgi:hypothetical protein